jgi:Protein of unknown function (DUF3592)
MLISFVLTAMALAAIFGVILMIQSSKRKAAAKWSAVQGRIVSAQVYRDTDSDGDTRDQPIITYEYVVNGQTFHSKRVKFGFTPKTNPTMAKYPAGSVVQVFYDPAKPADSVLER